MLNIQMEKQAQKKAELIASIVIALMVVTIITAVAVTLKQITKTDLDFQTGLDKQCELVQNSYGKFYECDK